VLTLDAAIAVLDEQRAEAVAEFRRRATADLAEAERKVAALAEELVKARTRTRLLSLTAPIDGTVQQLAVHTIGGVVTSAQPVLVVVPHDARLEIEAMISNRDIGFVRSGQAAEIKVDAFDFTRFGLVHGTVESLSQDAIARDRDGDRARRIEPRGGDGSQDLSFAARIRLERTRLDVAGTEVNLAPGMTVTVEIKTGRRSVLSFLLSPIARYRQDALRER
jgi:hemolysin D